MMRQIEQSDIEVRAEAFAEAAHAAIDHRRKYTGDPYIVHPRAVAAIVRTVRHTPIMLAASYLHDTVENTNTSIEDIEREFGAEVAELVGWLTDVSTRTDGNRAARKAKDRAHSAQAPAKAQTIKVADLIHNSATILKYDPNFARVYLVEKAALLDVLVRADPILMRQAREILKEGQRLLASTPRPK